MWLCLECEKVNPTKLEAIRLLHCERCHSHRAPATYWWWPWVGVVLGAGGLLMSAYMALVGDPLAALVANLGVAYEAVWTAKAFVARRGMLRLIRSIQEGPDAGRLHPQ